MVHWYYCLMCKCIHKRGKIFKEHKTFASEDKRRLKRIRELEKRHLSKRVAKNKRRKKTKTSTTKKKQNARREKHGHYIIMLNEQPDGPNFPYIRLIKVGYGNAKERIKQYQTTRPQAYIYRYWLHHKNIEKDLLDITRTFGKGASTGREKGREVFKINVGRLKLLAKHYDENVFDKRMK